MFHIRAPSLDMKHRGRVKVAIGLALEIPARQNKPNFMSSLETYAVNRLDTP